MNEINKNGIYYNLFDGRYSLKQFAAPEASEGYSHLDIPDQGHQIGWKPILFKKSKEEGPVPDYVCTDICGRICSPKLRSIIDDNLTKFDSEIQWLEMLIENKETGKIEEYYYLHFPEVCDTLNMEKTLFSPSGIPAIAVFDYNKVKNRSIFNCPKGEAYTIVSKSLKDAIFKAKCSGIKSHEAKVVQTINEKNLT